MFKKAILFDSWMFPLREEATYLVSKRDIKSELLFINCQRFQGRGGLSRGPAHFGPAWAGFCRPIKAQWTILAQIGHIQLSSKTFVRHIGP